jgi:ABC-type multidrug transport system fused ATPase/permease subunit
MIELTSGKIMLHGYDTSTLPRPLIRQKLICLTQQPFLFTGSVRLNANPLCEVNDSRIADVLKKVELLEVILRKIGTDGSDMASILDTNMDENFLSHGQKQLFCLARAMLKKGSILLLDEPTSRYVRILCQNELTGEYSQILISVDIKTDSQMQAIIRTEFKHHTIIMIAHRLHSLLGFDRVAVLDKGMLVEFGEPQALLEQEGSAFSRLYHG